MPFGLATNFLERPRSGFIRKSIFIIVISWMAVFPIYSSYYKAYGMDHYRRHMEHVRGNSMFFNPWQYRILCPLIIEGLYWIADHTVFALVPIHGVDLHLPGDKASKNDVTKDLMELLKDPNFIKYTFVFLAFRFLQNVVLLLLLFRYFSYFMRNQLLITLGLMISVLFMGNGVVDSDLTFNTYMDITLYVAAGIVIVQGLQPWSVVLLTVLGALNRETALFIPILYFFSFFSWSAWPSVPNLLKTNRQVIGVTAVSLLFFGAIFVAIRLYYGFQPVSSWRVNTGWPMLKLNLFSPVSIKTYMEFYGATGLTLIWATLVYPNLSRHLKLFFLVLVPIWLGIHLFSAIGYQSRLFLVPTLLVLLPAVLEDIERSYLRQTSLH